MQTLNLRNLATNLVIAILYYGAGSFGLLWAVNGTSATSLWPPAGIAAAAVLTFGPRVWAGILLGAFAANLAHFISLQQLNTLACLLGAAGISVGNLFEALAFYYLTTFFIGKSPLEEAKGLFKFVPVVALSCTVAASIGFVVMIATGLESRENGFQIIATWWLGDALAILILAPLLTSWWPLPKWVTGYKWFELSLAFVALLLICELIFLKHVDIPVLSSRPTLVIPILVWLAFRFSRRELVTALGLVTTIAMYATAHPPAPVVAASMSEMLLSVQLYCAILMMTMLILSAMVTQMNNYQEKLARANEELENKVAERTSELQKKARILEAFNNQLRIEARERVAAEKKLQDLQGKES